MASGETVCTYANNMQFHADCEVTGSHVRHGTVTAIAATRTALACDRSAQALETLTRVMDPSGSVDKLADAEQRASNAAARIRALEQELKTAKALVADANVRPDLVPLPHPCPSLPLLTRMIAGGQAAGGAERPAGGAAGLAVSA